MYLKFAVRDGAIVTLSAAAWIMLAERSAAGDMIADLLGFACGALVGVSAFLIHEWGHVVGAWAAASTLHISDDLATRFMFSFDPKSNSVKQFVSMSLGGFAATALLVGGFYLLLPDELLATRVARGAVLFLALLGATLELPLLLFGLISRRVPAVAAVSVSGQPQTSRSDLPA